MITLRDYQDKAAAMLTRHRRGIVVIPAGGGKTIVAASAIERVLRARKELNVPRAKIRWIAGTTDQCDQARVALNIFNLFDHADIEIGCPGKIWRIRNPDLAVIDECFPAGTLIDGIPIEEIKPGDIVSSFNHSTGKIEPRPVVRLFKQESNALVRLHLSNGTSIECTANHPFFTAEEGYQPASIIEGMTIYENTTSNVQMVRQIICPNHQTPNSAGEERRECLLRKGMLDAVQEKGFERNNGADESDPCIKANAGTEPDEAGCNAGKALGDAKADRSQAMHSGRERARNDGASVDAFRVARADVGTGICREDEPQTRAGIPDVLQDRPGVSFTNACGGSGRDDAHGAFSSGSGPEKAGVLRSLRVDRVEVLEPANHGNASGGRPVYNFEVEGNNNYFANGILVHNCHHVPADSWAASLDDCQRARWGFTATPFRNDELTSEIFNLIGNVIYQIDQDTLRRAGAIVPGIVKFTEITGDVYDQIERLAKAEFETQHRRFPSIPKKELLNRCRYRFAKSIGIETFTARNAAITDIAIRNASYSSPALMLVGSIEHGDGLLSSVSVMAKVSGVDIGEIAFVHSKTRRRKGIVQDFRDQKYSLLIATSLADEGFDAPCASTLILAAGGRAANRVEQRAGRVLRPAPGKTHGTIFDFNDTQHPFLQAQSRARRKVYKTLGYKIL